MLRPKRESLLWVRTLERYRLGRNRYRPAPPPGYPNDTAMGGWAGVRAGDADSIDNALDRPHQRVALAAGRQLDDALGVQVDQ